MNFCVRPSKSFLFDILEKELGKFTSGVGLDAASERMKNRNMFKTDVYYGLDIDLSKLQNGLSTYKSNDTFGILADITKLDSLPGNSVDVVVSTNTLYKFSSADRIKAIANLSKLVSPQGYFLCDFPLDENFHKIKTMLIANFIQIKITYFKNTFSQLYEWLLQRNNWLDYNSIGGSKPFRLFSWLLSRIEFLTCRLPFLNRRVIIICSGKRSVDKKNDFDLSSLPLIKERIYNLLD
jgi:SAM-dependent methyltransferase